MAPHISTLALALLLGCTPTVDDDDDGYAGGERPTDDTGEPDVYDGPVLRVGTFNIEWLRDYYLYRNATDYEMVAALLNELEPDVFGLQEIEGDGAIEFLYEHGLDEKYKAEISREGDVQRTAILWNDERVRVSNQQDVDISPSGFRDLNAARVEVRDHDLSFVFATLHLASAYDEDNVEVREDEVLKLHTWMRGDMHDTYGDDAERVVVAGDFNDTFSGEDGVDVLQPLEDDDDLVFATRNTITYTQTSFRSKIDHVVLDQDLADRWLGADDEEEGCLVFAHDHTAPYSNYEGGYDDEQNISDHRPVFVELALEDR